jgi:mono/diheme cytochrome c family protein
MRCAKATALLLVMLGGSLCFDFNPLPTLPTVPAADAPASEFTKVGVSFVEKHCVHCHGAKTQKADLSLHTYRDELSVLKNRKAWQNVVHMVQSGEMPPKGRQRPDAADIDQFLKTVKGVFAKGDATRDPGRVTVRRLNKVEYNNTIRDLMGGGVDFNPAEDFPADDVGHGFDNIGDVLSLPPVLLERYLAAAESIVGRSFLAEPPKPSVRHQSARYLEPAGPNVPQTRFRPITKGNLNTLQRANIDGEYTIRTRVFANQVGDEPVRIALLNDGKELQQFEVKATEDKKAERFEASLPLPPGDHRIAVTLLNPFKDDNNKERTLHVEFLELVGPKDTRPPFQRNFLAIAADKPKPERTRAMLDQFASKAYRRPATKDEADRLVQMVEKVEAGGGKWETGIELALQAVLVSPKFLFRVELDNRPDSAQAHPIDEYQLASRLSYFLWSSMPDDELFALAAKKQLTANLDAQVKRMLQDTKANALTENFAMQWLQLGRLQLMAPDTNLFPQFNDRLRRSMLKETELFFEAIVKEDRSILDLIDGDFTFLNEPLARLYGIVDSNGNRAGQKPAKPPGKPFAQGRGDRLNRDQFQRVSLADGERGGILTQASVLTVTSNPTRTSPVKRGRWVLEQLLGTPPPPPPPNVPELDNDKGALTGSLRERMEKHRANVACANCHARMDPLGFAFENYNAIGAFRTKDGNFEIDASGTLTDGKTFKGPAELKAILKEKKDVFARCLTEKMLTFALGRGVEYYDKPTLDKIGTALAANQYKFSTLVTEIVKSDPFRLRRGKESSK